MRMLLGLLAGAALLSQVAPSKAAERPFAFAPYAFMNGGSDVAGWSKATGGRYVTLAFYNAANGNCAGAWPEGTAEASVLAAARALQAQGGGVIVSTGGWNADDLVSRCPDAKSLADVYDGVLQRFRTDYLDLDAEPGDIHNNLTHELVDRRSAAMRVLQDRFAARGRRLHVSFTLAVRPAVGMDPDNLYVLQSAKAAGVTIDMVNPMIMDYHDGASQGRMGARSIQALELAQAQLKALLPGRSDRDYWGMMSATPMLGQNDVAEEVFTLDDARLVARFAVEKGMGRLSFWSLARDNGSCPGEKAKNSCSGLDQPQWAFSRIFMR